MNTTMQNLSADVTQSQVPTTLSVQDFQQFGLVEADMPAVQEIVARLQPDQPETISLFGRDVAEYNANYADALLAEVRSADLQDIGSKLEEIVTIANNLNAKGLADRSNIPIIGRFIDRAKLKSKQLMSRFETASEQINSLIQQVEGTQNNIATRNEALNEMYQAVLGEYRLLGLHIAAGKIRLEEMRAQAADMKQHLNDDPSRAQALMDYESRINNLDKRVGDLTALQHSALQSMPTIRMIQANNQLLVDKFHTIREVTIAAWKREFMLAISLNEQKNAVELANEIDNTTNALMRRNANLLHQNSVAAAKANQRLVIDVSTLKEVNNNLIRTVQDVLKIQHDGEKQRKDAEVAIQAMQRDLQKRITH